MQYGNASTLCTACGSLSHPSLWDGLKAALQTDRAKTLEKIIIIRPGDKPVEFSIEKVRAFLKKTKGGR